jgi:peptidoglycan/LPS O-acetylase OafA/YrhL
VNHSNPLFSNASSIAQADCADSKSASLEPVINFDWLTRLKGVGILWIVLVHAIESIFPTALLFSNPHHDWGTLNDRIQYIMPLSGYGWANIPVNVFRYVSWLGDQGVQLFLIASGFGLTWSLLQRPSSNWNVFYRRRLWKLYPLWWGVHVLYLIPSLILHQGLLPNQTNFYLSLLGLRSTPGLFYYFSPAWWFMGLILQLYLIFPLLFSGLKRWGALRFLLGISTIALCIRGVGLFLLDDPYLDLWSRGNVFITRLPEFALGMAWAAAIYQQPKTMATLSRSKRFLGFGVLVYGAGLGTAFTLWGMTVSPFLLAVGLLIVLYPLLNQPWMKWIDRLGLRWFGEHSYGFFLVHHPLVARLVPNGVTLWRDLLGLGLAIGMSVVLTIVLESVVNWICDRPWKRLSGSKLGD